MPCAIADEKLTSTPSIAGERNAALTAVLSSWGTVMLVNITAARAVVPSAETRRIFEARSSSVAPDSICADWAAIVASPESVSFCLETMVAAPVSSCCC